MNKKGFKEADTPSGTCVAYSLLNHLVYCGNRKGEVNIYDIRMHKKIQRLIAHESCVKAVTLDADEYFMATGSSEGNVKVTNTLTFLLNRLDSITNGLKLLIKAMEFENVRMSSSIPQRAFQVVDHSKPQLGR